MEEGILCHLEIQKYKHRLQHMESLFHAMWLAESLRAGSRWLCQAWLGPGQSSSLAVNHQGFMNCVSLPFVHPLLAAYNMQVSYQHGSKFNSVLFQARRPPSTLLQAPQLKGQNYALWQNTRATKRILFHLLFLVEKPLFDQNTKKCFLSLTLSYSYTQ